MGESYVKGAVERALIQGHGFARLADGLLAKPGGAQKISVSRRGRVYKVVGQGRVVPHETWTPQRVEQLLEEYDSGDEAKL
jgi:hypothetical protein